MKNLILLTTIISTIYTATAQWVMQSPYPTSHLLWDVCFVDENIGWIMGEQGTIMYTNDGGTTWEHQESGTMNHLTKSSFIDSNNGWILGDGILLHTIDGGQNWMEQSIPDTVNWCGVEFKDQNNGWLAGKISAGNGIIIHTADAGNNWEVQLLEPDQGFYDLCFISLTSGWVVGDHGIYHTNDGGENWSQQYSSVWFGSQNVSFTDSLNGWTDGEGPSIIMHTTNGGETWIPDTISDNQIGIVDISFLNNMEGWITCCQGEAGDEWCYPLYTSDGGSTWNACPNYNNHVSYIYGMCFIDTETGWLVGSFGNIAHTSNGVDWNIQSMITNDKRITDICFFDDENGWAVGSSYGAFMASWLMQTNNGGEDWIIHTYFNDWLKKIFKINENNFFIIGEGSIYQTKDGGENWEIHYLGMSYINDLYFTDVQNGWVVCWQFNNSGSKIHHTSDEGESWVEQYTGEGEYLKSIYFRDNNTGWVVGKSGDSGIIVNTIDGGLTWTNQLYANNQFFIKVYFSDPNNGLAIGNNGSVFQTDNGGIIWTLINEGFDVDFFDVFFVDLYNIWAIGSIGQYPQPVFEGLIYYSSDSGETWTEQESGTSQELLGIWFNNSEEGWISGENGTILHTDNGGIYTEITKTEIAKSNIQLKNYPNPFNSKTTIEFTLPDASLITLSVYDLSGKKLETIISKLLSKGDHEISWNAAGHKVGIYFIRLETEGETLVQKAIIIK